MLESSARRTSLALACGLATALLATGCSEEKKGSAPKPTPTPLANLNTGAMQIPRIAFCKLVPAGAVRTAIGGKPDTASSYGNGDVVEVAGVGKEVVHETGCSWSTDTGSSAKAWVFARPVDAAFARQAIASSRRTEGCKVEDGPAYGEPSLTQTCRPPDGSARVRHAGLFGQTWLTCEVTDPAGDVAAVRERADAWCVEVVNALNTAG
jgi:hypothetical protein